MPLTLADYIRAYPRACGGAPPAFPVTEVRGGLSPRMRGSRGAGTISAASIRPIPAHAGEPSGDCAPVCIRKAYPRACGGATSITDEDIDRARPIPAHAGEPR